MSTTLISLLIGSALLVAAGTTALYYATYVVNSQWLGHTDWHGRTGTAAVALTFDDGPSAETELILDILADHKVCATFFMIGRHVELFPQIARRVAAEGHEIGNHSYSHPIYLYRSPRETRRQLQHAQSVITETTGVQPEIARPPCGVRTPAYFAATRQMGLRTVQWNVAGFDWQSHSADAIAHTVLHSALDGSIILLHDGDSERKSDRRETVKALPLIIEGLHKRGLRIVPLTQLLGYERAEGKATRN